MVCKMIQEPHWFMGNPHKQKQNLFPVDYAGEDKKKMHQMPNLMRWILSGHISQRHMQLPWLLLFCIFGANAMEKIHGLELFLRFEIPKT